MAPLVHSIIEHSHVMHRTRSSSKHKCEPHVKVADDHHVLCCNVLAAHVLYHQIILHNYWYVSAIYCTNTVVEKGENLGFCSLG